MRMAALTRNLVYLLLDSLLHGRVPIANARDRGTPNRVDELLPVFKSDVNALSGRRDLWTPRRAVQDGGWPRAKLRVTVGRG